MIVAGQRETCASVMALASAINNGSDRARVVDALLAGAGQHPENEMRGRQRVRVGRHDAACLSFVHNARDKPCSRREDLGDLRRKRLVLAVEDDLLKKQTDVG